jgi:hypothetical protein
VPKPRGARSTAIGTRIAAGARSAPTRAGRAHRTRVRDRRSLPYLLKWEWVVWVAEDAQRLLRRQPELADEAVVKALAPRYEVSPQAMEFRLANLGRWTPL